LRRLAAAAAPDPLADRYLVHAAAEADRHAYSFGSGAVFDINADWHCLPCAIVYRDSDADGSETVFDGYQDAYG
jgi:hypothetical protein